MLANLNDVLLPAKKGKYAVGLFNAVDIELARGVLAAAESTQSPVIMGTAEVLFPYGPLDEVSYYLIPMAKKAINFPKYVKKAPCQEVVEMEPDLDKIPILTCWPQDDDRGRARPCRQ